MVIGFGWILRCFNWFIDRRFYSESFLTRVLVDVCRLFLDVLRVLLIVVE